MLKRIQGRPDPGKACVKLRDAQYPEPFAAGLEYSSPARGTWNIVHTGMLLPESHQIYVCSAGCLRGVILTAAEMGEMKRFSTIAVRENNVLDGDMEDLLIEGVTDILNRLPAHPRAVLLFTACIHYFMGTDLPMVYDELRRRFPDVDFAECYMDPIMRKSGLTAEQSCRKQLYSFLKPQPPEEKAANIIGSNLPLLKSSDIVQLLHQAGWKLREIPYCRTYEEYQEMARGCLNIYYDPIAGIAAKALEQRLGQKALYLPVSYDYEEIRGCLNQLCKAIGLSASAYTDEIAACEAALAETKTLIGQTPLALDYSLTFRPFSLARLLLTHGFCLTRIYADTVSEEDAGDFHWLQQHAPELELYATKHANMRLLERHASEKLLALGQKAAYFNATPYFVNFVETGGLYGFDGILQLTARMREAFQIPKDTKKLVQQKGWGCNCCL